jgi:hypothetical protein
VMSRSLGLLTVALALACSVGPVHLRAADPDVAASPGAAPSAAASPAAAASPGSAAPSRDFDAALTSYFGPEHFIYMAVKDPNIDGPLMHRPLDSDASATAPATAGSNPAQFIRDFLEDAKKEKIVEANFTELAPDGFAVGMAPGLDSKKEPAALFVAPKNPRLVKFYDWVVSHYQKKNGADSVKTVTIDGVAGTKFLKNPRGQPVMVLSENALILSNQEDQIARALKRSKEHKDTIATAKFYKRARSRVGADAAMFVMLDPLPLLTLIEQSAPPGPNREEQVKKIADARKNFEAVDALLIQLGAEKAASHVDLSVLLDPASPSYKNFKQLAGLAGVKASSFASAETPAFLAIIRPGDLTAGVAPESRPQLLEQLQSINGMLQVQTGLDFDRDVAPWWGNEIALILHTPEGGAPPEGALIFEAKDPKSAQDAVDKVVRHVGVAQNRTFSDRKVGDVTIKCRPSGGSPAWCPPTSWGWCST